MPQSDWGARVTVNGSELSPDAVERIATVFVEQHLHLPDVCNLRLTDVGDPASAKKAIFFRLLDDDDFPIGGELEVDLGLDGSLSPVFMGEITAIELDVGEDGLAFSTVRAYARSHRLHRGRQSRSFLNMSDSDIVSKVAQGVSLKADVEPTSPAHDYVLQYNQTDWEFLRERAARNGFELFVADRTLHFRKPKNGQTLGPPQKLWDNLLRMHVTLSSADQVDEEVVRCWNVKTKLALVGTAMTGSLAPTIGEQRTGAALSSNFGSAKVYVTDRPVATQAEADTLAQAIYNELDAAFVEAEGTCHGDPRIAPGITLDLPNLGTRLSGKYYVTSAVHTAQIGSAYTTSFTVGGRRAGGLYDLVHATGQGSIGAPSVVIGVVTDNTDSEAGQGRVKVKLPWLDDSEVSAWARVASPMAGKGYGLYCLPEVNDEVIVSFEHGDPARPFILGVLWNGLDTPPKKNADVVATSKVNQRMLQSRSGHVITLDDTQGAELITIVDKTTKNAITIDSTSNTVTIKAEGDVVLTAKGDVTISATGDATVKAQNATVQAQQQASVTANTGLALESKGTLSIQGATVSIKADASLTVDGGGMLGLKGGIVNIN